jgi:hypothetical protein
MHFRSHETGNIVWVTQIERHMHVMSQIWNWQWSFPRPPYNLNPESTELCICVFFFPLMKNSAPPTCQWLYAQQSCAVCNRVLSSSAQHYVEFVL